MIITSILGEIFQTDEHSLQLASQYVEDLHNEIGVEWIGRQNIRIGMLVAYMRVVVGPEETCKEFNRIVSEFVCNQNPDEDEPEYSLFEWMTLECVTDLRKALEENPYSEDWFIEEIKSFIMEQPIEGDACHLVPIESV